MRTVHFTITRDGINKIAESLLTCNSGDTLTVECVDAILFIKIK